VVDASAIECSASSTNLFSMYFPKYYNNVNSWAYSVVSVCSLLHYSRSFSNLNASISAYCETFNDKNRMFLCSESDKFFIANSYVSELHISSSYCTCNLKSHGLVPILNTTWLDNLPDWNVP
jgi:hypothetical protein